MSSCSLSVPCTASLRRWAKPRPAVALWIALAVALAVKSVVSPVHHSTYPCFEMGTQYWWAERDVYDPATCPHEYRYGPAFAVAMTPCAMLPMQAGEVLWNLFNVGFFFWTMRAFARRGLPWAWSPKREELFLALVWLGTLRTLWAGQTNMLVFALVAWAALALHDGRWWRASFLLAAAVHIKVWPVAAALLLVACRPRQLAGRLAAALLAIAAVPFLTKPFEYVWRQYEGWYALLTGPALARHEYRDAWTVWELIHSPVDPRLYTALQLAAALAALGLCLWQERRLAIGPMSPIGPIGLLTQRTPLPRPTLLFVLVMWTAWQLVFGPGTERNTFGLIAPLTSWGLIAAFQERRGRLPMGLAFLLTVGASFGAIERWLLPWFPAVTAAHPVGVALFVGWFLWWNKSLSRRERGPRIPNPSFPACHRLKSW